MARDSDSEEDEVPVKSETKSVPRRRSRREADADGSDPDQPAAGPASPSANKRARRPAQPPTQSSGAGAGHDVEGASAPASLLRDSTGYVTGSIVRVKCSHFVTYDHVEFFPGPALNMVLGPNGTGKSTIACAIALGLGFPPKVLGRSNKVSEFVKIGHESGWVEIELKGTPNKRNVVIRRHLSRENDRTSFSLNGEPASGAEVAEKMRDLDVQVENLCTFLPQDRVASFSQMGSSELLRETQRAAGDRRLSGWHEYLAQLHQTHKQLKEAVDRNLIQLSRLEDKQRQQERDVQQFEQRRQLEDQLEVLKLLVPSAEYDVKRDEHNAAKEARNEIKNQLEDLERSNKPFKDSQDALSAIADHFARRKTDLARRTRQLTEDGKKRMEDYNRVSEGESKKVREQLDGVKADEKQRKSTIHQLTKDIRELEHDLGDRPAESDPAELNAQLQENTHQRQSVFERAHPVKVEADQLEDRHTRLARDEKALQTRLQTLQSSAAQRETECKRHSPDTWEATVWMRKAVRESKFHGQVTEPARLNVHMKPEYANLFELAEGPIPMGAFNTFVFSRQADYDFMMHHVNDQQVTLQDGTRRQLRVSGAQPPEGRTLDSFKQPLPEDLKRWGFDCWAIDLITGPELVLTWLCHAHNLHRIPICLDGNRKLDSEAIERSGRVARYYTPDGSNSIKRSSYGQRGVIVEQRALEKSKVLGVKLDQSRLDQIKAELVDVQRQKDEIYDRWQERKRAQQQFEHEITELDRLKRELEHDREQLRRPVQLWEKKRAKLETRRLELRRERDKPSAELKTRELQDKLRSLAKKGSQLAVSHAETLVKATHSLFSAGSADLQHLQADTDLRAMDHSGSAQDRELNEKRAEYAESKLKVAQLSAQAKELMAETRRRIGEATAEVSEEVSRRRTEEQASLDELRREEEDVQARLGCMVDISANVLKQYEERKAQILDLREKVEGGEGDLEDEQARIDSTERLWLPKLECLIADISAKFTAAFEHLGLRGEIRLDRDQADYAKWGIEIWCSFRDSEKMQILNSHRQSGGERALTTVMYLMSLAELAKAPFALVDEINQGMDQRVERQVHNALVRTTCKDDVGQYFLITPKLLPDLDYDKKMKVLIINNGQWIPNKLSLIDVVNSHLKKLGKDPRAGVQGKKSRANGRAVAAH